MKLLRSIWINHHHFKNEEAIRVSVEFNILEKEKKKKESQISSRFTTFIQNWSSKCELDLD